MSTIAIQTPEYISPGKQVQMFRGSGDPKRLLLLMGRHNNLFVGLGDHIASLPVIYELRKQGYELTVYANPFVRSIYERAGCEFVAASEITPGLTGELLPKFGRIYWLCEWSLDSIFATEGRPIGTFADLFASFFQIEAPLVFNYAYALGKRVDPQLVETETVIYNSRSSTFSRNIMSEGYLHSKLNNEYNTLWIGPGQELIPLFADLVEIVSSAKAVFTCDTGMAHLAMALGVPTFAVFGPSDSKHVVGQYFKYVPLGKREIVQASPNDSGCQSPCSFDMSRGWRVGGRCSDHSRCLIDLAPDTLLSQFHDFLQGVINVHSTPGN